MVMVCRLVGCEKQKQEKNVQFFGPVHLNMIVTDHSSQHQSPSLRMNQGADLPQNLQQIGLHTVLYSGHHQANLKFTMDRLR